MDEADLQEAHKRYSDNKRSAGNDHHFRQSIRAHDMLTSPSVENSESRRVPFYREFDVAYLAIMKWGSSAAVERQRRKRQAESRTRLPAAKLVNDINVLDAEMIETEQRRKAGRGKRGRAVHAEDLERNEGASVKLSKTSQSLRAASGSSRKDKRNYARSKQRRSVRKAAMGKFYGEERDELDTRIGESALGNLVHWGSVF